VEVIGKLSDIDRCFCVSYRNEVMDVGMWRQKIERWGGGGEGAFWDGICTAAGKF
jgi:hypothetical protein